MSRTYRKRENEPYWWTEDEYIKGGWEEWHKKTYLEALAYYHSDNERTMHMVPKWYKVYFCRRPFRRKETVALIKEAQRNFDGEVPFPVCKKDAMYYW